MIRVDWSVIMQMVNFIILIWALNYVVYRPIRGILAKRGEKVEGLESGIERFEKDAGDKWAAFEDGIRKAKEKGQKMKESMAENAQKEEQERLERINEKAQKDIEDIRNKIVRETEEVQKSLQPQIDFFATEISRKMLGRAV